MHETPVSWGSFWSEFKTVLRSSKFKLFTHIQSVYDFDRSKFYQTKEFLWNKPFVPLRRGRSQRSSQSKVRHYFFSLSISIQPPLNPLSPFFQIMNRNVQARAWLTRLMFMFTLASLFFDRSFTVGSPRIDPTWVQPDRARLCGWSFLFNAFKHHRAVNDVMRWWAGAVFLLISLERGTLCVISFYVLVLGLPSSRRRMDSPVPAASIQRQEQTRRFSKEIHHLRSVVRVFFSFDFWFHLLWSIHPFRPCGVERWWSTTY